jgi:hypothetical protein
MTTKKQSTKKGAKKGSVGSKGIRLSDPRNVERAYNLLRNDTATSADPLCLGDEVSELLQYANATEEDVPEVFTQLFTLAARRVERRSQNIAPKAEQHYKTLQKVLAGLDAGETIEEQREAERRRWNEQDAEREGSEEAKLKSAAHRYVQKAYDAALAHFHEAGGKPVSPFFYESWESGPQEFDDYRRSAVFFAHILESQDCPKEFRKLFGAVFGEMLEVAASKLDHPHLLPLVYPIARDICDASNYCGTAEGLHNALIYAVESMVPEGLAEEARAALKKA